MLRTNLLEDNSCPILKSLILEHCGGDSMVVHGEEFILSSLPVFVCSEGNKICGFCVFKEDKESIEIIAINALISRKVIGLTLIDEVKRYAVAHGKMEIKLTTTNENLGAIVFYKKMGFNLYSVDVDAVTKARMIKPSIPLFSEEGVLIKDELHFSFAFNNKPNHIK
ncbi:GNAT family N-acetyltransferase [Serratia sp. IR-2025]